MNDRRTETIRGIRNSGNKPSKVYGSGRTYLSDSRSTGVQVDWLGRDSTHLTTNSLGATLMVHSTESDYPDFSNVRLIENAMNVLKKSVSTQLEQESRLERLCRGWQKKWLSQCEQLRIRIDSLEAQLAPWMTDRADGPRLAVLTRQEDMA